MIDVQLLQSHSDHLMKLPINCEGFCNQNCLQCFHTANSNITMFVAHIKERHPWFWTIKGIISKHPNMVATGLGNNTTGYNLLLLHGGSELESEGPLVDIAKNVTKNREVVILDST